MKRLGRYELQELIGQGGMGKVYKALWRGPGGMSKPVALKVLTADQGVLKREARLGGLLRHPHLVDVYEVGCTEGTWFCAMEWCNGGTLADLDPLTPAEVASVGIQVADALQYAHDELGLVHLDIKPENIMLHQGMCKVGDLGIARATGFEDDGRIRGTPGFMPPEQARGASVDTRTDIYALGRTLTALLDQPSLDTAETIDLDTLPEQPRYDPGELPPALREAVLGCLALHPGERWDSMKAFADTLTAAGYESLPVGTVPLPLPTSEQQADLTNGFVGREEEARALEACLRESNLLVIWGAPGVGKSRLVAEGMRSRPSVQVDVDHVDSPEGLLTALMDALQIHRPPKGRVNQQRHVANRLEAMGCPTLVFDNADRLDDAALTSQSWLPSGLVFTRRARPPEGVTALEVLPLGPDDSLKLLQVRALDRGVFDLDESSARTLVEWLDGIPLALELAAGRLGVLDPQEVLAKGSARFLRSAGTGRHGSLASAYDWAWELLSEEERAALAQLSVFEGSFTLTAAELVLESSLAPVDVLTSLLDRALLQRRGPGRFSLFQILVGHAASKRSLAREGALERIQNWAQRLGRETRMGEGQDRTARLIDAQHNHATLLRLARVALEERRPQLVDLLHAAAAAPLMAGTAYEEPTRLITRALEECELTVPEELGLRVALATFHIRDDAFEKTKQTLAPTLPHGPEFPNIVARGIALLVFEPLHREAFEEAQAVIEGAWAVGPTSAWTQGLLTRVAGNIHYAAGEHELSAACFARALKLFRDTKAHRWHAVTRGNMGTVLGTLGRLTEAIEQMTWSVRSLSAMGELRLANIQRGNLAVLQHDAGNLEEAERHYVEALTYHQLVGNTRSLALVMGNHANLLRDRRRWAESRHAYGGALARAEAKFPDLLPLFTFNLARMHAESGDLERALATLSRAVRHTVGISPELLSEVHMLRCSIALQRADVGAARSELEAVAKQLKGSEGAIQLAKLQCLKVRVLRAEGHGEEADSLLATLSLPEDYWEVRRALEDARSS